MGVCNVLGRDFSTVWLFNLHHTPSSKGVGELVGRFLLDNPNSQRYHNFFDLDDQPPVF